MTAEKDLARFLKWSLGAAFVVGILATGVGFLGRDQYNSSAGISTYDECAARYAVSDSYPSRCTTPDGLTFIEPVPDQQRAVMTGNATQNLRNVRPLIGEIVNDPTVITGEARLMYFEASFPLTIKDDRGVTVARGVATAQDDWMTEEFVPFTAELSWEELPTAPNGVIVFTKDNPSGLPENDAEARLPIRFAVSLDPSILPAEQTEEN